MLFSSAFLGYYLGTEVFGWKTEYCLALSGICIFVTIILETCLFVIKDEKGRMIAGQKEKAFKN